MMASGHLMKPLRDANYRRLWLGQMISVIGDKVNQLALGVLVYASTGSALQMGVVLAISMLPAALFGMVAGALVDRFDHRRTMVGADLARAALVLAVPFVADTIVLVYAIAFVLALISLFFEPAKLSLIPQLVEREDLMAANSLDNATVSVAELLGLALAGGVVASVGYHVAFFFDAATFVVSALFVLSIRHRAVAPPAPSAPIGHILAEALDGLRYVRAHAVLRHLIPIYAVAAAGVAASFTFIYLLALDSFASGAAGVALLDGSITVGLLLGSVAVGQGGTEGAVRKLLAGLLAFGGLLALVTLAPSVGWAVPLFVMMGVANMYFFVPMATVLQTMTTPAMQGRAFAAKQTTSRVFSVIGYLGAGALAEAVGLSSAILLAAGVIGAAALIGWSLPRLRARGVTAET